MKNIIISILALLFTLFYVNGQDPDMSMMFGSGGTVEVADFFEFSQLVCQDALHRNESCGAHFREESQSAEGEALRKDDEFSYVAAWQYKSGIADEKPAEALLHKETLKHQSVAPDQRSYK